MEERFQKWLKTDLRSRHRVNIKLPGFVFRAEETKESTVDSLMASSSPEDEEDRSVLSYLNPLSYIVKTSPVEDESGEGNPDERQVSVFGFPLFTTEQAEDVEIVDPPDDSQETAQAEESKGFWSSLNPF